VEIGVAGERISLGTFARRTRPRLCWDLNFHDVNTHKQAEMMAMSCLVTDEEKWRPHPRLRRLYCRASSRTKRSGAHACVCGTSTTPRKTSATGQRGRPSSKRTSMLWAPSTRQGRRRGKQLGWQKRANNTMRRQFILAQEVGPSTISDNDDRLFNLFLSTSVESFSLFFPSVV
jgi:hypothetical protein